MCLPNRRLLLSGKIEINMNKEIYLNPKIFSDPKKIEQVSICRGFEEGLLMAGDHNKQVVALCPSFSEFSQMDLFAKEYPERFFENDITEQSMFSVAFGMAEMGKIPFILSSIKNFLDRGEDQIKIMRDCNNTPIKIVDIYKVSTGQEGERQQTIEEIALIRSIPRMIILTPCDAIEAQKATIYVAQTDEPVYLRLACKTTPVITTNETPFEIGKAEIFFRPDGDADVGVIATGPLVYNAIRAAKELDNENIKVRVLNLSTIKPMDIDAVIKLGTQTGKIVIIEEHQTDGGVGSVVAEVLVQTTPVKMRFIGAHDMSGISDRLAAHRGTDIENIKNIIREIYAK